MLSTPHEGKISNSVEYLFASSLRIAEKAALKQGWHANGRAGWFKPDGNQVHFICFEEQLAVVGKDATIYFVGELSEQIKRFNRKWTRLRA